MEPYNPQKCKIEYHPDDTPECYLPEDVTEPILLRLEQLASSARDRDTLDFIRRHEESQRLVAAGAMSRDAQQHLIDGMAHKYLKKHGDWVHTANPLYRRFYALVMASSN
ncbi:MAG: hypothetical protein WCO89_00500 [Syntrophus sp. (in: bacteria)]